jgi:quercetin dioxygenase-like cupin family protein
MTDQVRDPVSGVRMSFQGDGEDLIVDLWLEPGGKLPAHWHPKQEERWSVVAGRAGVRLGDETHEVTPADGEVVVVPNAVHAIESIDEREAHLRCHVTPALRLQEFLTESCRAAEQGYFTRRGLPRGLRGARWAARFLKRYRDETVFVEPPQFVQRALIGLLGRE